MRREKNLEGGPREVFFFTFSKVTNEPQQLPQGRNPPQKLKEGPPSRPYLLVRLKGKTKKKWFLTQF